MFGKIIELDEFFEDVVLVFRDCGTGAGGFQPGNTCGGGEGGGDSDTGSDAESGDESDSDTDEEFDDDPSDEESQVAQQTPDPDESELEKRTSYTTDDGREIPHYAAENYDRPVDLVLNDDYDDDTRLGRAASKQLEDGFTYETENVRQFYIGEGYPFFTSDRDTEELIDMPGVSLLGDDAMDRETVETIARDDNSTYEQEIDDAIEAGEVPEDVANILREEYGIEPDAANEDDIRTARDDAVERELQNKIEGLTVEANYANMRALREAKNDFESALVSSRIECCIELARGLQLSDQQVEEYIKSGYISHEGANSWTVSNDTAKNFGGARVTLRMRKPTVGWVNSENGLSEYEVIRPPARQKITRVTRTGNDGWLIDVEEDSDYQ